MSMYGTVVGADAYFDTRLHADEWANDFSLADKTKALQTSTRDIDRLNFVGSKADSDQELEFPRGTDTDVPSDIEIACYEIAFERLVNEKDPQAEVERLNIISEGFSSIRATRDRDFAHEHLRHGIVSLTAWKYLRPYLRNDQTFILSRVS